MESKVVLVTGGSKGIGREMVRILLQRGDFVYICARDEKRLHQTVQELDPTGVSVKAVVADVSSVADCQRVIDTVVSERGRLDIVVCNAGMAMRGSFAETNPAVMEAMVRINLLGPAYLAHLALEHLIRSKGSIQFISSLAGLHGLPRVGMYCASKGALTQLTESLRAEVHRDHVHVGITYVGFTENDPDKVVYGSDGSLVRMATRKNSQTQQETAACILRAIDRRQAISVLTAVGKVSSVLYRWFPRLSGYLITVFATRSSQYAES